MVRRFKMAIFVIVVIAACMLVACITVSASDTVGIPDEEWQKFESSIPDSVLDKIVDGATDDKENFLSSVNDMSSGEYMSGVILDIIGIELGGAIKLFFGLCAMLALAAIFSSLAEGCENASLITAMRFCSVGGIIGMIVYLQYSHFEMLEELFASLGVMISGIIPVSACIWAMGGNVGTASVGSASFSLILSVVQTLLSHTLIPVCSLLTVLGFCDALSGEMKMGKIIGAIKKIYNFVLALVMTVLLSSMAAQSTLAASADTAAARTARLVSGTVIPVLGGSVGETFRTVAAGVSYLKSAFGIGSIIMICLLVLPTVIELIFTRFSFMLGAGIADMLGCVSESRVLENLNEVYGTMLAVVSGVSVTFVMTICVFMRTVVAVA